MKNKIISILGILLLVIACDKDELKIDKEDFIKYEYIHTNILYHGKTQLLDTVFIQFNKPDTVLFIGHHYDEETGKKTVQDTVIRRFKITGNKVNAGLTFDFQFNELIGSNCILTTCPWDITAIKKDRISIALDYSKGMINRYTLGKRLRK